MKISGIVSLVAIVFLALFVNKGCTIEQRWENLAGHYTAEYSASTTPSAKIAAAQGMLNVVKGGRLAFSDHAALIYDSDANNINVEINGIENLIGEWRKIENLNPTSTEYQVAMTRKDLNLQTTMLAEAWLVKNHPVFVAPIFGFIIGFLIVVIAVGFMTTATDF